jgi:hypothetical protein
MLPQSCVAYSVMPPLNPSVCSDPPPETGMLTMPWYLKSVSVADPAVSTDAAEDAMRSDGAAAFFRAALLFFELADLSLAEGDRPGPED